MSKQQRKGKRASVKRKGKNAGPKQPTPAMKKAKRYRQQKD
ncbi:MAG: hypothetical protein WCT16_03030 [Candidatus Buchananbacteria bacterium]